MILRQSPPAPFAAQFAAPFVALLAASLTVLPTMLSAQPIGVPARALAEARFVIDTAEQGPVGVTVMKGLELPWDMAWLPGGELLVTERTGTRIRIVRDLVLDPAPVSGMPEISSAGGGGLMSILAHPDFARNGWIYFSYTKPAARGNRAVGLTRARLDGTRLSEVREIFAAEEPGGGPAPGLPLVFGQKLPPPQPPVTPRVDSSLIQDAKGLLHGTSVNIGVTQAGGT
jgi:glucose/arabinose dehydrogenase